MSIFNTNADSIHKQWNAINCDIYYFIAKRDSIRKNYSFSVWVDIAGTIRKTPDKMAQYKDRPIQVLIADYEKSHTYEKI